MAAVGEEHPAEVAEDAVEDDNDPTTLSVPVTPGLPPPTPSTPIVRATIGQRNEEDKLHNERLKAKGSILIMQRAQRNLCRKLGYLDNDTTDLTEEALHNYINLFKGPRRSP